MSKLKYVAIHMIAFAAGWTIVDLIKYAINNG